MTDVNYIKTCLKPILGEDTSDEIAEYVLQIRHEEDYNEFMENIVDLSNPEHREAHANLKNKLLGSTANKPQQSNKTTNNVKDKNSNLSHVTPPRQQKSASGAPSSSQANVSAGKGKKLKFVNFYTQDHKPGLKKGRHPCNCEAQLHELINNCTKCGRIVCEQEGSGPCFFCDSMVCTKNELELLADNSKESDKLYNYLMERSKSKEWKKAIETRDRLVNIDRFGSGKNIVYDDQSDYFMMNDKWNTEEEKKRIQNKQMEFYSHTYTPKNDLKFTLDFATRTATFYKDEQIKNKEELMKGVNKLLDTTEKRFPKNLFHGDKAQLMAEIIRKMEEHNTSDTTSLNYTKDKDTKTLQNTRSMDKSDLTMPQHEFKVANSEFLESLDQGMCLSMHQPYASLLVAGIKKHEGRTWKTAHRGRLWIAAAAKQPTDEEILECEEVYRTLYNDPTLQFPKRYPTSCLLGCVYVEDCLPQNEYRKKYPDGESESPFVLICTNPVILPIFHPISGQHKIFPLNKDLHRKAKAGLMSARWV